jgi:hypothetical protein
MVIDYTGPVGSLVNDTRQLLQSGAITTTSATASHTGLGYADNAVTGLAVFSGLSVDPTSLLLKFTYLGDCDLDGDVDVADLGSLATNWQSSAPWSGGDFDYNGSVDVNDLGLLATNWQAGVGIPLGPDFATAAATIGLPASAVPEPATFLILTTNAVLRARRRKSC